MINNKVLAVYRYHGKCVVDLETFFATRTKYSIVDFIRPYTGSYHKIVFYIWKVDALKNQCMFNKLLAMHDFLILDSRKGCL